jgi:hypothetical protein
MRSSEETPFCIKGQRLSLDDTSYSLLCAHISLWYERVDAENDLAYVSVSTFT